MTQTANANAPAQGSTDALAQGVEALQEIIAGKPDSDHLVAELVRICCQSLRAAGAGVWVTEVADKPDLIIEQNLPTLMILVEGVPAKGVVAGVKRCARESKPLIVPPHFVEDEAARMDGPTNPSACELFFMPLKLHGKVGMVLMMALVPTGKADPAHHRACMTFLQKQAWAVELTLTERHLSLVEKDRGRSSKLLRFAEQVHRHMFLGEVAADISNLSRDVLDAQRVTVELYPKLKKRLTAVSNVDEPNKRSSTAQVQRLIFDYVRDRHVPVVIDREAAKQLVSDPTLQDAAAAYFLACDFDAFIATPIKGDDPSSPLLGVILAEYSDTASAQANSGLLAETARLCTGAVSNALDVEAVPLIKPFYAVRKFWKKPASSRRSMILTVAILIAAIGVMLCIVPFDHAIKADCQIRPSAQLSIVAPLQQRIISVPVRAGEHVYPKGAVGKLGEAAKPLAVFDSIELMSQRAEAVGKMAQYQVEQKDWEKKGEMGKISSLQNQIEQAQNEIHRIEHQIEQCTVWSPIEGTVLTENVEQKQYSTPRQGDALLDVASFSDWELVVDVPESEVADVRAALQKATQRAAIDGRADAGIEVEYILYPWPDMRYALRARGTATLLPASQQSKSANVFRLQVKLEPGSLPPGLSMSGVTGRAKVHVGNQPLAWQLTRGLVRLLKMTLFF